MPPPQEIERLKKRVNDKRRGKTVILTSSPYKAELEAVEREKKGKQNKQKRKLIGKLTESNINYPKSKKEKKIKKIQDPMLSSDEEQNSDNACIFYNFILTRKTKRDGFNVAAVEFGHMKTVQALKKVTSISHVTFVFEYFFVLSHFLAHC